MSRFASSNRRLALRATQRFTVPGGVVRDLAGGTVTNTPAGGLDLIKIKDNPTLPHPQIKPVFWGAEWVSASPPISPAGLVAAMNAIVTGPYLDGLAPYGLTGQTVVLDPLFVSDSEPNTKAAPGAWGDDAKDLLYRLIDGGELPEPDDDWSRLTVVFLPSTLPYPTVATPATPTAPASSFTTFGFHSVFQYVDKDFGDDDDDPVYLAVVGTAPFKGISGFDMATYTFSHELVEAMTDPNAGQRAWYRPTAPKGSQEIADSPCGQIGRLNGFAVSSYWSLEQKACIIPGLTRSAFLNLDAIEVTAETDGAEQFFLVERDCGRNSHWSGTYSYHITKRQLTLVLDASLFNWIDPVVTWTVAGQAIAPGAPRVLNVPVTSRTPGLTETSKPVTATVTALAARSTLTLRNDPGDGNYTIPVQFSVAESVNDPSPVTSGRDITVEGQKIVFTRAYTDALSKCVATQIHQFGRDMQSLGDKLAEFMQALGTGFPHPNEGPVADALREAARTVRQLQGQLRPVGPERALQEPP